jgi:hypothetical protein
VTDTRFAACSQLRGVDLYCSSQISVFHLTGTMRTRTPPHTAHENQGGIYTAPPQEELTHGLLQKTPWLTASSGPWEQENSATLIHSTNNDEKRNLAQK